MNNELKKAYLFLHIAILLFGFTAILGKTILLGEVMLVWHRLWITLLSIVFIPGVLKGLKKMNRREVLRFVGIGVITCIHWLAFYGSIKLSNASIALSCLATMALFTSIIEPMVFKRKVDALEVILGVVVLAGIIIITRASFEYREGIAVGLLAAFLAAVFSTLNKKYMGEHNPVTITFLQLGSGFLFLTALLPGYFQLLPEAQFMPGPEDWVRLIILAVFCTSVAYVLALMALKHISAFASNLAFNLEPVYGILMAAVYLKEYKQVDAQFYLGTALILSCVFLYTVIRRYQRRKAGG